MPDPSANGRRKRAHKTPGTSSQLGRKGNPRRRLPQPQFSPSPTPAGSGDEDTPTARKRQKQCDLGDDDGDDSDKSSLSEPDEAEDGPPLIHRKYWRTKGKILGRCVEMWDTFNGILDQGVSRNPINNEDYMHTALENQQYQKFLLLVEVSPAMAKLLERAGDQAGPEFTKQLDEVIDIGRKRARRVDVSGVRGAIAQWPCITWVPAYPVVRHLLGFNHPVSGELLCPATLDWGDFSVRERLCRGVEEITATDLPAFLWSKGDFDIDDPYKGFLRGPLLLMAYRHIFISPSSAKEVDKSTRGGNAALHDISFVTYESIAYVATVTRFALSDEPTFGPGGCSTNKRQRPGFPYRDFYRELLEHKSLMSSEERSSLIQWWNGMIFPCTVYSSGDVKKDSVGAVMRERVRAKQMALEAARVAAEPALAATSELVTGAMTRMGEP
ncbi:hypothetical protein BJY52DRAFT_1191187 [Lactarius psammicola]|nr:hypothetical protein BJY52DRAFT_1191187 [Lactarius psammicola]